MPNAEFPEPVSEVIATITDIFQHQERNEILELLRNAYSRFDETGFDNWNGGTYTWTLRLEVPVSIYTRLESRLDNIEKEILEKLNYLKRLYQNDIIDGVTITPITPGTLVSGHRMSPSEHDIYRLWKKERFRLFLSHVAKHKIEISKLKSELALRGVDAFLAHKDIKPSLEWCNEIELGLRSMNALAALITKDFHKSLWTDQEIGWALGRDVVVVPVRLGKNPYGFSGKYQGISGDLNEPESLAISIIKALLDNKQTHGEMRRSLVKALAASNGFLMSIESSKLLESISDFTEEEKMLLWKACEENDQVSGAFGVTDAIYRAIGEPPKRIEDGLPF